MQIFILAKTAFSSIYKHCYELLTAFQYLKKSSEGTKTCTLHFCVYTSYFHYSNTWGPPLLFLGL